MPGPVTVADWLFAQPEFDERVRSRGVRFVGLCDQTLVRLDGRTPQREKAKALKEKFKLALPAEFPVSSIEVEFSRLPKEPPPSEPILIALAEKAKSNLLFEGSDLINISFEITEKLLNYIHDEMAPRFRIDPSKEIKSDAFGAWPYQFAAHMLAEFIVKQFAVYANICKIGGFTLRDGFVKIGDKEFATSSFNSAVSGLSYIEAERGIRLLRELDFQKSWSFYTGLKGTFVGAPKTAIEIAVSNLTDLFDDGFDQSGARNLIWGFAGLEALLADNDSSVGSQLRQKLVALFGNQVDVAEFEKDIVDIYRYRSKIIHGNAKSGSVLRRLRGEYFNGTFDGEETTIAIWLLVAVIQYCFQNHRTELKFKTVVQ